MEKDVFKPSEWVKADYKSRVGELLAEFCEQYKCSYGYEEFDIKDLQKESQQIFYSALRYIHSKTFAKDNYILKDHKHYYRASKSQLYSSNYNAYDYEILSDILDIYTEYADLLNKIPDQKGYSLITGINIGTIYNWISKYKKNNINNGNNFSNGLNQLCSDLIIKLLLDKKSTLEARAFDGKINPTGAAIVLNNEFYNVQQSSSEQDPDKMIAASDLAGLLEDIKTDS